MQRTDLSGQEKPTQSVFFCSDKRNLNVGVLNGDGGIVEFLDQSDK